jgi:chromosome segregation ATPase
LTAQIRDFSLGKIQNSSQNKKGRVWIMQDASTVISTERLNELVNSIAEVRRSLEVFQDRKTEALIDLDAFTYDVQKVEEDRNRLREQMECARKEYENQAKIFQEQIRELTDQMQLLKFENEGLRSEVTARDLSVQGLISEVEHQKRLREQMQEQHEKHLAVVHEAHQKALADEIESQKKIQLGLAAQVSEVSQQRDEAETRLASVERDLSHIRTHMLGILQGSPASKNRSASGPDMTTIHSISEGNASTVDDYLKRLGY